MVVLEKSVFATFFSNYMSMKSYHFFSMILSGAECKEAEVYTDHFQKMLIIM